MIAVGLIGYYGTTRLAASSSDMRDISELNAAILEVDRDVQELQMWAEKYITTGHDSMRDSVFEVHDKLTQRVSSTISGQSQSTPEMLTSLTEISRHLKQYRIDFDSVVEERQLRTELAQSLLPAESQRIASALAAINGGEARLEQADKANLSFLQCETLFHQSEQLLIRYYESPDSAVLNEALEKLDRATAKIAVLEPRVEPSGSAARLVKKLQEYKRVTLRAVQATRGYLFLVNVVMAGEASEVAYYSDRLRTQAETRRISLSTAVSTTLDRSVTRTAYSILAATFLAVLMAARLGVLILPPITSLTSTFQRLAGGETLVDIPETKRNDEIGEMAKAARVFSDQNQTTRKLLTQAETLSRQLQKNTEELTASNEELDSFAYVASHDLKSPLRGIRQLATWIQEDSGHFLPEKSIKHLQLMNERVTKMETLLQDLLDYSRVGRLGGEPEDVSVSKILAGIVSITDNPEGVVVRWREPLPEFTTLRQPLDQVLLNLIGNAIKHNHMGADGFVDVTVFEEQDWYRFRVQDNGPGIDKSNHERIFQLYQRVGDTSVDGSGMGLAIVKKQVESFGGSISVASSLGAGTTFEFNWPMHMPRAEEENTNE